MATANPPDTPSADESVFDAMREQIIAEFDRIMREVKSRRDQLLSEVDEKRREFELKNSAMIESMRELEEMRSQLEKMSVKQNVTIKRHQESLANIESDINKLRTDLYKNTQLKYSCSLDQLIQQIKQFGEIIDESKTDSNYCRKPTAVKVIDGFEGNSSIRLHVDSYKELFYVIPFDRNTVMAYNRNSFKFVQEFGQILGNPRLVTASKEYIFVISTINRLYQYRSSDFSFVTFVGSSIFQLFTVIVYIGIAVSEDNQVILMDSDGSIKLHDIALKHTGNVKLDLKRFGGPERSYCISLVMRDNIIYILLTNKILLFVPFGDWNNISCYFKKEQLLFQEGTYKSLFLRFNSLIFLLGKIPNAMNPSALTIDSVGNVIVADSATNSIKFLSPEGDLIHTIGEVPDCCS